jgi:hypothetical protein
MTSRVGANLSGASSRTKEGPLGATETNKKTRKRPRKRKLRRNQRKPDVRFFCVLRRRSSDRRARCVATTGATIGATATVRATVAAATTDAAGTAGRTTTAGATATTGAITTGTVRGRGRGAPAVMGATTGTVATVVTTRADTTTGATSLPPLPPRSRHPRNARRCVLCHPPAVSARASPSLNPARGALIRDDASGPEPRRRR